MKWADFWTYVVEFVTGGGLLLFARQIWKTWSVVRSGARTSVTGVIKDMERRYDAAVERATRAEADADYWRQIAAGYGYQLRSAGAVPDPQNPYPPSAPADLRRRTKWRQVREPEET